MTVKPEKTIEKVSRSTMVAAMGFLVAKRPSEIEGDEVPYEEFEPDKIFDAIEACYKSLGTEPADLSVRELTSRVLMRLMIEYPDNSIYTVEQIQQTVVKTLGQYFEYDAQSSYMSHMQRHAEMRAKKPVPYSVRKLFDESSKYFKTPLQQFQFFSKYSRFDWKLKRRETWKETVKRAVDYLRKLSGNRLEEDTYKAIEDGILCMEVMPSMRLLAMAGEAADRNNICLYNCSFSPVNSLDTFVEALIISMCGCGVGFSVQEHHVQQLPDIKPLKPDGQIHHIVDDSSDGWAKALRLCIENWFNGIDVICDLSLIRPRGAVLKTKGGRASGPEPLRVMLKEIRTIILNARSEFESCKRTGPKLKPIEAHDIMCYIGDAAVQGGVRRSALISLFSPEDNEMRLCKSYEQMHNPDGSDRNTQRWNANNSAVWPESITEGEIRKQFEEMFIAGNGEPGIFNLPGVLKYMPERREKLNKDGTPIEFGCNPCAEIILRPNSFCNLSAVIARSDDTVETLKRKVFLATAIGTIQSTATYFPGLRPVWKQNCEEERLLGVDITGQMDCYAVRDAEVMQSLKEFSIAVNKHFSDILHINDSASITCVKPSGNTSYLVDCSSGLHGRWSPYYIRRVRETYGSPIYNLLKEEGVPLSPENGQTWEDCRTVVASFPVKSPEGAITIDRLGAVDQLEHWKLNKLNWTEHNPSITCTYKASEQGRVVEWVLKNRELVSGIAFLPYYNPTLSQPPNEEVSKDYYEELLSKFPKSIDWSKLPRFEDSDYTEAAQTLACVSGNCDV